MGNALVVRKSLLPKSQKSTRAAQYVRMSTDYQQYSIENQAVVIGAYRGQRNYDYIGQRPKLNQQLIDSGDDFAMRIRALGASTVFDAMARTLSVENRLTVSLRIGRYYPDHDKVAVWHVHRNANLPSGLILALRLNKKNTKIVDYFVIPTTELKKIRIALRATLRYSRFDKYHAASIRDAVRMIMEGVAATSPVLTTKRVTKGLARSAPAKVTTGRARH